MSVLRVAIAAALLAGPAAAQPRVFGDEGCFAGTGAPTILVQLHGLADRTGTLRVELYPLNDTDFLAPDFKLIAQHKTFRRAEFAVPATGPVLACLRAPEAGGYALAVIHNRHPGRTFAWRRDGIGFPGDPHLALSRPPARKAAVTVGEGLTRLAITLQYWNGFLGVGPVSRRQGQ